MPVAKYLRVDRAAAKGWQLVPGCERVPIWEVINVDVVNDGDRRTIFHVPFHELFGRGQRVTFLGNQFDVLDVSDSPKLRGVELNCSPAASGARR